MADNVAVTEGSGKTIATDDVGGAQYQRVKLDGGGDGLSVPFVAGSQAAAASLPVTDSTEDVARVGAVTETAPATDTASSGLNGRLQRVAQRLTSLIALLPASLGQKARAASLAVTLSSDDVTALTPVDPATATGVTAITTSLGTDGTSPPTLPSSSTGVRGWLRLLYDTLVARLPLSSGRLAVDGSGVTQPVSAASLPLPTGAATEATLSTLNGKIPASPAQDRTTAGSPSAARLSDGSAFYKATTPSDTQPVSASSLPLPTGAATETTLATLATAANQSTTHTRIGDLTETAPATDTASSGLNGRLQRVAQRLTSLIALLPSSIGQKAKAASLAVTLASDEDLLGRLGEVQASPAANTVLDRLKALLTGISLAAGTNRIGKVTIRNTADGADIDPLAEGTFTTRINTLGQKTGANSTPVVVASDQSAIPASQSGTWTVQPGNTPNTTPWLTQEPLSSAARTTRATVDLSSSGTATIVSAVGGQTVRVHKLWLTTAGAVTIDVRTGASTSLGKLTFSGPGAVVLDLDSDPWFVTTSGEALSFNLSAAVVVTGRVYYTQGA